MFSLIEGGFAFTIKDLFTMDFSWLFASCFLATTNVVTMITILVGKIKKFSWRKKRG
jgi:hypothetical protein